MCDKQRNLRKTECCECVCVCVRVWQCLSTCTSLQSPDIIRRSLEMLLRFILGGPSSEPELAHTAREIPDPLQRLLQFSGDQSDQRYDILRICGPHLPGCYLSVKVWLLCPNIRRHQGTLPCRQHPPDRILPVLRYLVADLRERHQNMGVGVGSSMPSERLPVAALPGRPFGNVPSAGRQPCGYMMLYAKYWQISRHTGCSLGMLCCRSLNMWSG